MKTALTSSVLQRFIQPDQPDLSPAVARYIDSFKLSDEEQAEIDVLADKCTEGTLTEDERREYESIVVLGEILTIMKAKARLVLRQQTPAA